MMIMNLLSLVNSNGLRDIRSKSLNYSRKDTIEFDDDVLLKIYIDHLDSDFDHDDVFLETCIRVHICNEDGRYILPIETTKIPINHMVSSEDTTFHEPRGFTSKVKKQQLDNDTNEDVSFSWKENVIFNISYKNLLDESIVILFEILEAQNCSTQKQDHWDDESYNHVAWGFLKPIGRNGKCNVGTDIHDVRSCRLQLFKYEYNSMFVKAQAKKMGLWSESNVPHIFLQYLRKKYVPIEQTLYIQIGPMTTDQHSNDLKVIQSFERSTPLESSVEYDEKNVSDESSHHFITDKLFRREKDDKCLISDRLLYKLEIGRSDVINFSSSGDYLAIAVRDDHSHNVYVYELEIGRVIHTFRCHSDMITSLEWCSRDKFIATASMDGTIVVNNLRETIDRCNVEEVQPIIFPLLTHSLPIHLAFLSITNIEADGPSSSYLVSGCKQSLKLWSIGQKQFVGDLRYLGHKAPITAISADDFNRRIFSGDAQGDIIIWKLLNKAKMNCIKGSDFEVLYCIDGMRNLNGRAIRALDLWKMGEKRLVVTTEDEADRNLCIYDFACQTMIPFCSESKLRRKLFTTGVFSPDGELVLCGTSDGELYFVDSSSGISHEVSTIL